MSNTNKCNTCGETKNIELFVKDKGSKSGYRNKCSECHNKSVRKKYFSRQKEGNKTCMKCKVSKDVSCFWSDKTKIDGLQSFCADCKKNKTSKNSDLDENIQTKECIGCTETKLLKFFDKSKIGTFGRHNDCKDCRCKKRKLLNYDRIKEGTKTCSKCEKEFDVSFFHSDKSSTDGLQSACKDCRHIMSKKWASTYDGYMKKLIKEAKNNINKRAKDIKFEIKLNDILELYKKQNGICALSGIKMTHIGYGEKKTQKRRFVNLFNISIDRIDSNKDYTKDNIQLVCAAINFMKQDYDLRDFIFLCKSVSMHSSRPVNLPKPPKQVHKKEKHKELIALD